ncbi:MAG: ABC transporter permease [Eubacteriales bacterium]|nr:ABC transporter permease [Eubacteriales bacterium]
MLHLFYYHVIVKLRNFNTIFWPLVFPLIMATLFYFAFGQMKEADFETVSVGIVKEEGADSVFLTFLEELEESEEALIKGTEMTDEQASKALEEKQVKGIFYVSENPSLAVGGNGISESILQSVLESYLNGKQTLMRVMKEHPEGMLQAAEQMNSYEEAVWQTSLGGRTTDGNSQFFYALVAMACMYGVFIGFGSAITLQANITPLAARRSITPTHKLALILSEMLSSFSLHFANVIILLVYLRYILKLDFGGNTGRMLLICLIGSMMGVAMGIVIGSIGRMGESAKIGILLGISMVCSFLAGLMNTNVKNWVEQKAPFINRINPAALIADAFYCINVYDDKERYMRNLITLSVMCVICVGISFWAVRRERYDSI